ncbi:hypothetical protein Tco_0468397, partial [Tanacetum coccineum]
SDEVRKLRGQLTEADEYRNAATTTEHCFDDLRSEVAHFVGFDVDSLVRRLLSSDEFNVTLSPILSLAITFGVERGLRMGRTDAEFEKTSQNISNFFLGAKAEFNKVVAALPSAYFPFLAKIAEVASSSLPEVATFGRTFTPKEYELTGLAPDELPGLATYVMF